MSRRAKWIAIVLFLPVAWGYNWVVMKRALAYAGPFEFSAARFVEASACLFSALAVLKRPFKVRPILGVVWVGLLLQRTEAGLASLTILATPVLGILFSALQLGERPRGLEILGMSLIVVALLMVGPLAMRNVQTQQR